MPAHRKYHYDDHALLRDAASCNTLRDLAAMQGLDASALSKHLHRHPKLQAQIRAAMLGQQISVSDAPDVTVQGEEIDLGDIQGLLERRGMDAKDWEVRGARVQEYMDGGGCGECGTPRDPFRQLRVDLQPRRDLLQPARPVGQTFTAPRYKRRPGDRVAFLADPHCPFHDPGALNAFLAWVEQVGGIQRLVLLGDLLDLPGPSRHRSLGRLPSTQECVEAAYLYLLRLRQALPDVQIDWLIGNHDARISLYTVDHAPELHGLRQAGGGPEVLSLTHVLRLDELAIDIHHHEHGWEMGSLEISPSLAAWHEPPSKRQRDVIRYSVIHGHHHAQTWSTLPILEQRNHQAGRRMIVGAGTMADFSHGMGYAKAPGWTQGWCWADLWSDDEHEIAHVRYRDGQCWWPGGRLQLTRRQLAAVA